MSTSSTLQAFGLRLNLIESFDMPISKGLVSLNIVHIYKDLADRSFSPTCVTYQNPHVERKLQVHIASHIEISFCEGAAFSSPT